MRSFDWKLVLQNILESRWERKVRGENDTVKKNKTILICIKSKLISFNLWRQKSDYLQVNLIFIFLLTKSVQLDFFSSKNHLWKWYGTPICWKLLLQYNTSIVKNHTTDESRFMRVLSFYHTNWWLNLVLNTQKSNGCAQYHYFESIQSAMISAVNMFDLASSLSPPQS